ncbi:hypothetical protein LDL08_26480 [Nonomuraea glycinis]|uniref:Uncharacterized protein n=1 Tax=Nonomuraea glycinis TaxID=2047744 RepID=A0A918E9A8_9ACTN|nr:hypothetical protein [Nonomuraea glycinis]MCA2179733.1 hypothetical protein [Nonomuraea glycinis]GGP16472.1 hypothetical protein GCM10012278_80400 [Nonomuraea glycinis]
MNASKFVGELERIDISPTKKTKGPPIFATFLVTTNVDAVDYVTRLRAVLSAAIRTANQADFDSEAIPEILIPDWFAEVTRGSVVVGCDHTASSGSQQYVSRHGEEPWELQDWLFCFDPQLRGWAWWDVTMLSKNSVLLWVDSSGEPAFPCEELRWLAYACGAKKVEGPLLRRLWEWRESHQGTAT